MWRYSAGDHFLHRTAHHFISSACTIPHPSTAYFHSNSTAHLLPNAKQNTPSSLYLHLHKLRFNSPLQTADLHFPDTSSAHHHLTHFIITFHFTQSTSSFFSAKPRPARTVQIAGAIAPVMWRYSATCSVPQPSITAHFLNPCHTHVQLIFFFQSLHLSSSQTPSHAQPQLIPHLTPHASSLIYLPAFTQALHTSLLLFTHSLHAAFPAQTAAHKSPSSHLLHCKPVHVDIDECSAVFIKIRGLFLLIDDAY